jgi:membrane protein DedA with SNARE-associated domain
VSGLGAAIAQQGQRLIFFNVLLQQIGVPIPAEPTLIVAGSLVAHGRLSVAAIAIAALVATLLADLAWFAIGKRYGARVLRVLYRLSSSPERRQSQTEWLVSRWGPAAFAFAKFIPGLPMAGPLLAGSLGTRLEVFLAFDLLAMVVWASSFTGLGMIFHRDVDRALHVLDRFGSWGLFLAAVVLGGVIVRRLAKLRSTATAAQTIPS